MSVWCPREGWWARRWWPPCWPGRCWRNLAETRSRKHAGILTGISGSWIISSFCRHIAGQIFQDRNAMIHPIVKYGDPVLETPSKAVEEFDEELQTLVADMFESMYAAQGVGLAAPQIGTSRRVCVIDVSLGKNPEAKIVCTNPEVIHAEGEQREEEIGRA